MSQQELLKKVIQVLEDAGIEYMVSGSLVSSLQGEPRSTHDIDVVVAVQRSMARALARSFPPPGRTRQMCVRQRIAYSNGGESRDR